MNRLHEESEINLEAIYDEDEFEDEGKGDNKDKDHLKVLKEEFNEKEEEE